MQDKKINLANLITTLIEKMVKLRKAYKGEEAQF